MGCEEQQQQQQQQEQEEEQQQREWRFNPALAQGNKNTLYYF